ncbi:MAG: outer membrane beta-barrel protein [candidate division Zixibacteria bacterium]
MKRIVSLAIVAVCVMTVTAFAGLNFSNGGLRGGYVAPEDPIDATYGFGAEVGFGDVVPNVTFSVEASYWNKSYSDPVFTTWDFSFTDIALGLSGKYEYAAAPDAFYPYLGTGFGVHMLSSSVDIGFGSISISDTKFGVHAFGGFRVPVTPVVDFFAEARYTWVSPDYLSAWGGIQYNFGN